MNVRGFIFDLDGTLASSSLDFPAIRAEMGCPDGVDALVYIQSLPSKAEQIAAMDIIHEHENKDALTCDWIDGAEHFINNCKVQSHPIAIVTRNSNEAAQLKIDRLGIDIDCVFTRENSLPKPQPDALLQACEQFKLPVSDVIMVGDYLYDIQSGLNANMRTCLVNYDEAPEYANLATYCFPRLIDFSTAVFG